MCCGVTLVFLIIYFLHLENERACTAQGGNLDGPCIFPWKWGGNSYNECANPDNSEMAWCATRLHKNGNVARWGYCNKDCYDNNLAKYPDWHKYTVPGPGIWI